MSPQRPMRGLGEAVRSIRAKTAPTTLLAAAQEAWPGVAGEAVAAEAEPVTERDGVLTIAFRSATWAQELDLLQEELLARLNEAVSGAPGAPISRLRFTADGDRHGPRR